jgi:hypothetical protein
MSDKLQFVEVVRINSPTAKLERIDHSPDKLKFTGRQPVSDCLNLSPLVEEDLWRVHDKLKFIGHRC